MEQDKAISLKIIRNFLEIFGHDTSHLSDADIEKGSYEFTKSVGSYGVTTEQAMDAMSRMSNLQPDESFDIQQQSGDTTKKIRSK